MIQQVRYEIRFGKARARVRTTSGRSWTIDNVTDASRDRLAALVPSEYDPKCPYEKAQNAIWNPGFVVWRK